LPLIYLKLGTRLRHFLIDEFQDTDRRQWEALKPLVEEVVASGGSFFYVGDVKQAIYMWRGGDPELFFEVLEKLPADLRAESLPWNRRSARRIVDFNNRLFTRLRERLFQVVPCLLYGRTRASRVRNCEITQVLCARLKEVYGEVEQAPEGEAPEGGVYLRELPSPEEDREIFREEVYRGLRELMPDLYHRFVEKGRTVAILVRENREAEELAAFLFGIGLPALTERALRLETSPLVKGLLSLLRYLDYPGDETALAGFLASPLTRSGPEILRRYLQKGTSLSLAEFLASEAPGLKKRLVNFSQDLHRLTLYETVQKVVESFGLFERFPESRLYLMRFLSAVLAYEEEALSLSEFLVRWEEFGVEEKVGLPREIQAIRVFTIHAAKGLEFHAVVLPLLTWGPRGRVELVVGEEGLLRVRKEAPEDIRKIYLAEKAREVFESLNLLYVALTRAREELHLFLPGRTKYYTVASVLQDLSVAQILKEIP
ncbi:MAG: hypothetical protein DSZ24_02335, partial [Thermodesulfatator sp.]